MPLQFVNNTLILLLCFPLLIQLNQASSLVEINNVVLIKIGGSSITDKSKRETLNETSLEWFAKTVSDSISDDYKHTLATNQRNQHPLIIVHGAGSFGHHHAKEYGLRGHVEPPDELAHIDDETRRKLLHGLTVTRLSVQALNLHVVAALAKHGLNVVGISPGFLPGIQAHGGDQQHLLNSVKTALQAGLVPVLHGDACLYGRDNAGILSGDTIVQMIGGASWVRSVVFVTDVDGVYTKDPRKHPKAQRLATIRVDQQRDIISQVNNEVVIEATGSTHEQDVTGGLKTKLAAAASIAALGKNVTIVQCGSKSAEQVLQQGVTELASTVIYYSP